MTHLLGSVWNSNDGIDLGFFVLRFYSLMFVVAFGLGWLIMKKIFERENESLEKLDSMFIYSVLATLFGARMGHVIFYQSELFFTDPISIFLPIRTVPNFEFTGFQGLASHGAAISMIVFMFYFSKKIMKRPLLWVLDRVVIPVASGAVFVRLGNFFNSEIYGKVTDASNFYGVKFIREEETWKNQSVMQVTGAATKNDAYNLIQTDPRFINTLNSIPYRHPAQLYEAFSYIFVFAILFFLYWKTDARKKPGFIFGMFMILLWSIRFVVEIVKASQGGFEGDNPILSTGQWLSIPMILVGIYYVFTSKKTEVV
jgi:phosphatidylglycerol---prolipoprotein diacylglyceryl transferase